MRPFTKIAAVIFALMAVVHLFRLFLGWQVTLNGLIVPMWLSPLAALIAVGLAWMLWREVRK